MPKITEQYFSENGSDAMLPAEDMAKLLLGGEPEQPPAEPAEPAPEPKVEDPPPVEPEQPPEPEKTPAEPEEPVKPVKDGEEPVILAKDGKHTIEYEKLVEARENAKRFRDDLTASQERIDKLEATIADLTAPKEDPADAEAAQQAAEEAAAVIDDLKTNDPEIYAAVKVMLDSNLKALEAKFAEMVQPIQESAEDTALDIHFKEIETAHSDYEEIIQSGKIEEWIETQPSYLREAMNNVILSGTSTEVVELLSNFKDSQSSEPEPAPADDSDAAAAKEIVDKAAAAVAAAKEKTSVPNSLSAVPAGSKAHHDENAAMLEKSAKQQIDAYSGKSVSDIMDSMDKIL